MSAQRRYLGDGVYAIYDGGGIWLHANSHDNPTDRIYLEPETASALFRFARDIWPKDEDDEASE